MKFDFFGFVSIYNHFLFGTAIFYLLPFYDSRRKNMNFHYTKYEMLPDSKVFLSIWMLGKNKFIKRSTAMWHGSA